MLLGEGGAFVYPSSFIWSRVGVRAFDMNVHAHARERHGKSKIHDRRHCWLQELAGGDFCFVWNHWKDMLGS